MQCLIKCAAVLVFYGKIYHTHTVNRHPIYAIYSQVWAGLSSSLSFDCTSVGINPGYGSAEHRAGENIKQSPAECYLSKYQQLTFNTSILWLDSTPFVQRWIDWSLHSNYYTDTACVGWGLLHLTIEVTTLLDCFMWWVSHESASKQYTYTYKYTTDLKGFICCPVDLFYASLGLWFIPGTCDIGVKGCRLGVQ